VSAIKRAGRLQTFTGDLIRRVTDSEIYLAGLSGRRKRQLSFLLSEVNCATPLRDHCWLKPMRVPDGLFSSATLVGVRPPGAQSLLQASEKKYSFDYLEIIYQGQDCSFAATRCTLGSWSSGLI
jgi:hypothetical protein